MPAYCFLHLSKNFICYSLYSMQRVVPSGLFLLKNQIGFGCPRNRSSMSFCVPRKYNDFRHTSCSSHRTGILLIQPSYHRQSSVLLFPLLTLHFFSERKISASIVITFSKDTICGPEQHIKHVSHAAMISTTSARCFG